MILSGQFISIANFAGLLRHSRHFVLLNKPIFFSAVVLTRAQLHTIPTRVPHNEISTSLSGHELKTTHLHVSETS